MAPDYSTALVGARTCTATGLGPGPGSERRRSDGRKKGTSLVPRQDESCLSIHGHYQLHLRQLLSQTAHHTMVQREERGRQDRGGLQ